MHVLLGVFLLGVFFYACFTSSVLFGYAFMHHRLNAHAYFTGFPTFSGLDVIDSGGPSGSPKEVHIGNALPVEQVLVVLLHNHILLLHQPKVLACSLLFTLYRCFGLLAL